MRASDVKLDPLRGFPPPGLSRSAPRDVRLTRSGRTFVVLAWLLAAAAIPLGLLLYREARRQSDAAAAFEQQSVVTSAVVDRLWRKKGDGDPAFAAFHFDANGARVAGEARMRTSVWRELRIGSTVMVRYLPDDPARWSIAGSRRQGMPVAIAYLVAGTLGGLSLLFTSMVRRQRTLLSEGRATAARITSVKKRHGSHGATHQEIAYEFPLLGGGMAAGRATAPKGSVVGGTIYVVYDPDRPARNHPYPFSLVAPSTDY